MLNANVEHEFWIEHDRMLNINVKFCNKQNIEHESGMQICGIWIYNMNVGFLTWMPNTNVEHQYSAWIFDTNM